MAAAARSPIELTMERKGQTRPLVLEIPGEQSTPQSTAVKISPPAE
jgi:hypothetical protein